MKKIFFAFLMSAVVLFAGCISEDEGSYDTGKTTVKSISSPLDIVPKSSEKVIYTETDGIIKLFWKDSKLINAYKKVAKNNGINVDDIEYTIQADNAYILKGYGLDEYKFMDNLGLKYKEKEQDARYTQEL